MKYNGSHRKRHKGKHRRINRGSTVIKSTAVVVTTILGLATVLSSPVSTATADNSNTVQVAAASRVNDARASRAAVRVKQLAPAVIAPTPASPVKNTVGVNGIRAVKKPKPKPAPAPASRSVLYSGGSANGRCNIGVVPNAVAMCNYVYSNFPVSTIGGRRPGSWGDHPTGHALDVMVGAYNPLGDAIAAWAIANGSKYGVTYVIWRQRTWFMGRGGWEAMADRGSISANHYDHVHVSFG